MLTLPPSVIWVDGSAPNWFAASDTVVMSPIFKTMGLPDVLVSLMNLVMAFIKPCFEKEVNKFLCA